LPADVAEGARESKNSVSEVTDDPEVPHEPSAGDADVDDEFDAL